MRHLIRREDPIIAAAMTGKFGMCSTKPDGRGCGGIQGRKMMKKEPG